VLPEGANCQSLFDELLALEFSDMAYGAVHFLTGACFMIQHNRYSDEALAWIEDKLRAHLERGVPIHQVRRQAARETQQATRTWRVERQPGARQLPEVAWSMTIADAFAARNDAERYRQVVTEWARAVLQEMQSLL
jgi:hypothetical protein